MSDVLFGILLAMGGILGGAIGKTIHLSYSRRRIRRRDERFLGYLRCRFPETEVTYIVVGPSEKHVIDNLERRIRESSANRH